MSGSTEAREAGSAVAALGAGAAAPAGAIEATVVEGAIGCCAGSAAGAPAEGLAVPASIDPVASGARGTLPAPTCRTELAGAAWGRQPAARSRTGW
ncbi:hypothetical protein [Methyloraptor flagellatus]|uniref:Uncharacterized protein n=1 Tax=Methyloraptor flagellatus TaxID=3162530 RepID=A0AAU7X9E8_9HYPH